MTSTGTAGGPPPSGAQAAPPEVGQQSLTREGPGSALRTRFSRLIANRYVAPCLIVLLVPLLLLRLSPAVGALASVCLAVAFVPIATTLSGRLVAVFCFFSGLIAVSVVVLALAEAPFDLRAAKVLACVPALAAAGVLVFRPDPRALLPRLDLELVPLVVTGFVGWLCTGFTLLHRPQASVMGGLSALGWDHQSHFSIFVNMYTLGGVWRPSSGIPRPSFDAYPPLGAALSSWGVWIADGHVVPTDMLVSRYAQAAAVMTAISVAILAWLAAVLAASLVGPDGRFPGPRGVPALAGIAVGGYLCLGPVLSFFDYGFSNFLLACAVAAATSWLILVPLAGKPGRRSGLLAAGVATTSLLWTPLLVLLLPAGAILALRLILTRGSRVSALFLVLPVSAVAVPLWQSQRIVPGKAAASGLTQTVGSVAGGLPPVPLPQAVGFMTLGLAILLLGGRESRRFWRAALAPTVGGLLLAFSFAAVSIHTSTHPQHSYYFAKASWSLYVVALPLLGGVLGLGMAALSRRVQAVDSPPARLRQALSVGLAALGAATFLWSTLGYSNTAGSRTGYVAVAPAVDSVFSRWNVFRGVDAGNLVFLANRSIGPDRSRIPIIWDGGDLKQNRWLASLREQLDGRADAVYNPMPGGPYLQPAADSLRQSLIADPTLRISIAYFRPESHAMLAPLARDFASRVRLVPMG
jgi:hypothetical protein